jgi:hypothetical protein
MEVKLHTYQWLEMVGRLHSQCFILEEVAIVLLDRKVGRTYSHYGYRDEEKSHKYMHTYTHNTYVYVHTHISTHTHKLFILRKRCNP